ncbi:MAG: UDP-N-acetylmuramoyl-L-alanine--D-glutamate ligase [Firmicutes bacterium]|nr:UDP-N-acetylmuramoyl-L-alanine--D-glutamate ligase [Bacillota bacterium]
MKHTDLTGKKISILGLGKSGRALARVLTEKGASILVSDSQPDEKLNEAKEELSDLNIEWETGGHTARIYSGRDMVIISPGISIYHPVLQEAMDAGVHVISEVEMAFLLAQAPFIAITGTNGKSTTTTLIHETLLESGRNSYLAGNIGIPLVGEVGKIPEDGWIAAEISSFQLEAVEHFRPKIAALLNITSDHIDRHRSFQGYVDAKAHIFRVQDETDFAVLNADDEAVMSVADKIKSRILLFSVTKPVAEGAYCIDEGMIRYVFDGVEKDLFHWDESPLRGKHNLQNVLAVLCMCLAAGVDPANILPTLRKFKPLHYRMEYVDEIGGVKFYNDSKGTNPDAVRASLESFRPPLTLIAGGTDKNLDFGWLAGHIALRAAHVVLIGESRFKIEAALKEKNYENITVIDDMSLPGFKESIRTAFLKTPEGGVVLLSPSCASFDMFKRAEHRGEMFNVYVRELKEEYEKEV